ncbi:MAG: M2 family metallopeptidase [Myxococcales bacterium]|nr:M2 family metallopeptidase [Myxococcales bacterium]
MSKSARALALLALPLSLWSCKEPEAPKPVPKKAPVKDVGPTAEDASKFVAELDQKLRTLLIAESEAEWAKATDITDAHEEAAAAASAAVKAYTIEAIAEATRYDKVEVDDATRRQLDLLKLSQTAPAPSDAKKREELTTILAKMDGIYGKGKVCEQDKKGKEVCRDLGELSDTIAKSRKPEVLLEAWEAWRTTSVPIRPLYQRFVELGNEGAREIGFADMGELWRSRYDMPADDFVKEMDRLWAQVAPLYEQLHCHVRAALHKKYGDKVPAEGPIPAHVLGNMWAQSWGNIYEFVEPYPKEVSIDVTKALAKKGYDELKMVKLGEAFFVSLGFEALPQTFWERSLFVKPDDREVICHASAWDVQFNNDLRLKMCIKVDEEDLVTIHHELGHHYYFNHYYTLPVLFQGSAHDGFHEGIGDAIALSMTPKYLKEIGLIDQVSNTDKAVINQQMRTALDKIAFLPFGLLVDQWRWDVFAGKVAPDAYNAHWWKLRESVQGIKAPVERTEEQFDPGAKYHIPGNTPYARYFLAHILQFQFHKAMCEAAGHEGPLHECSIFNSKEAGEKLGEMLALGQSRPWPEALEKLTGTRTMDAAPLIEYFDPLMKYLEEKNKGLTCGF